MSDEIFEPRMGDTPPQKIVYKQYPFSKISLCLLVLSGLAVAGTVIAGSIFAWRNYIGGPGWGYSFGALGVTAGVRLVLLCIWVPSIISLFWLACSLRPLILALKGLPALSIDSEGICDYSSFDAPGRILWRDMAKVEWANEKMTTLLLYLNNPAKLPGPRWNRLALYSQSQRFIKYGTPVRLCGFLLKGGRKAAGNDILMAADIHQPAPDDMPPMTVELGRVKVLSLLILYLILAALCVFAAVAIVKLQIKWMPYIEFELAAVMVFLLIVVVHIAHLLKFVLSKTPLLLMDANGLTCNARPPGFTLRWDDIVSFDKGRYAVTIVYRSENRCADELLKVEVLSKSLIVNSDQLWALMVSAHKKYS